MFPISLSQKLIRDIKIDFVKIIGYEEIILNPFHFIISRRITNKPLQFPQFVPQFLTPDPYNRLICHFSERPDSSMGLRNLIIIMLHITTNKGIFDIIIF